MCVSDNRDVFRQVCLCWVKLGVTDVCDEFLLQSDVWYVHIKTKAVFRRSARVKEAQLESAHRIFSSTHLTKMETGSPLPSQAVQICRAVGRCYCICKSFEQSSGKFHVIFFFFFLFDVSDHARPEPAGPRVCGCVRIYISFPFDRHYYPK